MAIQKLSKSELLLIYKLIERIDNLLGIIEIHLVNEESEDEGSNSRLRNNIDEAFDW